jgi:ATP/maltotriose-dependent transcriptional regulator MalT/DNA-binding SARP family transcriptional activator
MTQETPYLAKLAKPGLPKVLHRERLFGLLDHLRQTPVIWLSGPPGCGKTTLVASYLERRQLFSLWYQVDVGDKDPAAFFYYMGIGAQRASPETARPLPIFTPEYLPGISTFTKRYFTDLFNRFKNPTALVLDNCQEADSETSFSEILRDAVSVLPPWINVFLLSRKPFPPSLARINASRSLVVAGWEDLRFTGEETRDLVETMGYRKLGEETVGLIHKRAEGWVAGVILMLQKANHTKEDAMTAGLSSPEQVFDYFATELLDNTDKDLQSFLFKTALLPRMTPSMAESLTGRKNAGKILADLNRNHFFTGRHGDHPPLYQYHALFRDFLLSKSGQLMAPGSLSGMKEQAAEILESEGFLEDAVSLYLESSRLDRLARLIPAIAPALLSQGRNRTVEQWIAGISLPLVQRSPWLVYWLGAARMPFNPKASTPLFENAFSLFKADGDAEGMGMALSGVLLSIAFACDTFDAFDEWIPLAEEFRKHHWETASPLSRALLTTGMLDALSMAQPNHESFPFWEEWGKRILDQDLDFALKTQIMLPLISHQCFSGEPNGNEHYLDLFHAQLDVEEVAPLSILSIRDMECFHCWLKGDFDSCRKACDEGLALAESTGIHVMTGFLLGNGAAGALSTGDMTRANALLNKMHLHVMNAGAWEKGFFHTLRLWKALLEEDHAAAAFQGNLALEYARRSGMPQTIAIDLLGCALALRENGETEARFRHLNEALSSCRRLKIPQIEYACLLSKAAFELDMGDDLNARATIAQAMALGARGGYFNCFLWLPPMMTRLCAKALEWGIEELYVQSLIQERKLVPETPPYELKAWPWPVRIQTLGQFQVLVEGRPVHAGPKTPKKVLSMLKAIIALGGRLVSETEVTDRLWPDADGDAAHRAFATTLHRLRRLIGRREVIDLKEGRLSLDPRHVWVDVWAFEDLAARAETNWADGVEKEGLSHATLLAQRALTFYKGAFLPGDVEEPWTVSTRERLCGKFIRVAKRLCEHWKAAGEIEKAIDCYNQCLETDHLEEELYYGLMGCHQAIGQKVAALSVYDRCKRILSASLGTEPSSELKSLQESISKNP